MGISVGIHPTDDSPYGNREDSRQALSGLLWLALGWAGGWSVEA
jgi:hypothetical protein